MELNNADVFPSTMYSSIRFQDSPVVGVAMRDFKLGTRHEHGHTGVLDELPESSRVVVHPVVSSLVEFR